MLFRSELSEKETEFLPITTKAYLYLSGTPFRALATGEFIEEQIFNWTYTDEQRAKEDFTAENPGKWNPYGALPQLRLLTYQMPDELLAIATSSSGIWYVSKRICGSAPYGFHLSGLLAANSSLARCSSVYVQLKMWSSMNSPVAKALKGVPER